MIKLQQKIERQEKILLSLSELTYATARQIKTINNLGSDRNARRILYELEKDNLIKSVRYEKKIYYVSNKGNDFIGKGNRRLNKREIQHVLMRNDLFIKLGMPSTWKKEAKVIMNDEAVLISDARYNVGNKYYFVEIDNVQTMKTNIEKIKKYKELFRIIFNEYRHHPVLVWYSLSDVRKKKLKEACEKYGVKFIIY